MGITMRTTARSGNEIRRSTRVRFLINFPRRRVLASLAALTLCVDVAFAQGLETQVPHRPGVSGPATRVASEVLWITADTGSAGGSRTPNGPVWTEYKGQWFPPDPGDGSARPIPGLTQLGISQSFASGWRASYGFRFANEEAVRPWSANLLDHSLWANGTGLRSDSADWRHFLGLEYSPTSELAFQGGIAKRGGANGDKDASLYPTGYEKLRVNAGARWRRGDWGLDSFFAFIPWGASRVPGDANYFPNQTEGDSGFTYLFALTVSRRF